MPKTPVSGAKVLTYADAYEITGLVQQNIRYVIENWGDFIYQGQNKMANILQMTFTNAFSWAKFVVSDSKFISKGSIDKKSTLI